MTIPIIIINWNGLSDTLECMESIMMQTYQDFHVYLIDNASDNNEYDQLSALFGTDPKVTLIKHDSNLGFTKAHNQTFQDHIFLLSNCKYVALLNNDTYAQPKWLHSLVSFALSNDVDIVSSKMIQYYNHNDIDNVGHRMINTGEIVSVGNGKSIHGYNKKSTNLGACAGACLYTVDMLKQIGTFDPFFETGYEDAEFGLRAVISGYKSMYSPNSLVFHKGSTSLRKVVNYDYILKIQTSVYYSYLKLMPIPVIIANLPSFIFKYLSILIVDILFLRVLFLKVLFHSLYNILFVHFDDIISSRKAFYSNSRIISSYKILRFQTFFLKYDISRFLKDVVLQNKPLLQKEL